MLKDKIAIHDDPPLNRERRRALARGKPLKSRHTVGGKVRTFTETFMGTDADKKGGGR